jgi:hypothetical protein
MLLGVALYQLKFKEYEVRNMFYANTFLGMAALLVELFQVKRFNIDFGISDMSFLIFSTIPVSSLSFALTHLPSLVLFQKMTPAHVEATMMAFSASVMNISNGLLGSVIGVGVNKWLVGVTSTDLSNYSSLIYIQLLFSFYQLAVV